MSRTLFWTLVPNAANRLIAMSQKIISECALCMKVRELRESHFLPSAMYKNMKLPGDTSQIILDRTNPRIENRQIRDYLLCAECEERFSKHGERWVMGNGVRSASGTFPLQTMLNHATPIHDADDFSAFSGRAISAIDMEALTYFAISVFWRGSAHDWGCGERLSLGSYQEEFRQFLLSSVPFPRNAALLIVVSNATTLLEIATFPFGGKLGGMYHSYQFDIPGVEFTLSLGQRIPGAVRRICASRSPDKWIFLGKGHASVQMALDLMCDRTRMNQDKHSAS
jgi:hypothetical protein